MARQLETWTETPNAQDPALLNLVLQKLATPFPLEWYRSNPRLTMIDWASSMRNLNSLHTMTKVIYESETLIGKCDYDCVEPNAFRYAEPDYAEIWVHTVGAVNQGLLKIEQHCYVRHGEDVPDQPWVRPQIFLEPATISRPEMTDLAKTLHHEFVSRAKQKLEGDVLVK